MINICVHTSVHIFSTSKYLTKYFNLSNSVLTPQEWEMVVGHVTSVVVGPLSSSLPRGRGTKDAMYAGTWGLRVAVRPGLPSVVACGLPEELLRALGGQSSPSLPSGALAIPGWGGRKCQVGGHGGSPRSVGRDHGS